MANNNWPHGFRPLMVSVTGAPVGVNEYAKPASDTNPIFLNDLLHKVATSATVEGQEIPSPGCQTFSAGTPGTTLILGSSLNYAPASVASWHTVVDDPTALFEAQCDSTTSITVASYAGSRGNANNTAQTTGRLSAMQVKSSTLVETGSGPFDLMVRDLYRSLQNAEGANAMVEVLILNHVYNPSSLIAHE